MNNLEFIRRVTLKTKLVNELNELISNLEDAVADREKGITSWVRATEEINRCRCELRAAIYSLADWDDGRTPTLPSQNQGAPNGS